MKKLIYAVFGLILGTVSIGLFAATNYITELKVARSAGHFQLSLPATPSTGYQWALKKYDPAMLQLLHSEYLPANSKLVGAAGAAVFRFKVLGKAIKNQRSQLGFAYERPWEHKKAKLTIVTVIFK